MTGSSLTKAAAFFVKEFHDVRRQPQLLVSLVGAPLLVLGAFAATFHNANPFVRTALVWPQNGVPGVDLETAEKTIGRNLNLVAVTSDEQQAMALLESDAVDAVQVVPDLATAAASADEPPVLRVYSRTVDPTKDSWIRSLSMGELHFINEALLKEEAKAAQDSAREVSTTLVTTSEELRELRSAYDAARIERTIRTVTELRDALDGLLAVLPPVSRAQAVIAPELYHVHRDLEILDDDLTELIAAMEDGELADQLARLSSTLEEMSAFQSTVDVFVALPPEEIVSPVQETYENLRGSPYSLVIFYTPAVLALLLQQLAITLGALGLVRERQMGAFEMFRVAPLRFWHVLLGKAGAYIVYVTLGGAVLTGLLALLGVPMPLDHPLPFAAVMALHVAAATGIGFAISSISRTDSQAIQLTMLALLLSIFFTGFFLPITGFSWPAWIIAAAIPMTPAITAFQSLLLKGEGVPPYLFAWFGALVVLAYGLVALTMRRRFRSLSP